MTADAELFSRIVSGDRDAFGLLYDRYAPILFSFCVRILRDGRDAEDVLQEVFVQVWRDARRFDPDRASLKTWLFTIARSRALDRYRSRRSQDQKLAPGPEDFDPGSSGDPAEASLLKQYVAQSLSRLSENERKVLTLAYYDGYTQEEIAALLKEPLGTVKSRARSGLAKLQAFVLGEKGDG